MKQLKEVFAEWVDYDGAMFELAKFLGMIPENEGFTDRKWIWCTDSLVNNSLDNMLQEMACMGVLEIKDLRVRWKQSFDIEK